MTSPHKKAKKYTKTHRPPKDEVKPLRLTKRDKDTLRCLEWLGVADTTQLTKIIRFYGYKPEDQPNYKGGTAWETHYARRLRKLWWHWHINRLRIRDDDYKLRRDEIYAHPSQTKLSSLHLRHRLERNEFLIALLLALLEHPTATLKKVQIGEKISFKISYKNPFKKEEEWITKKVTPDLAIILNNKGQDMLVFIEIDRSSESRVRLLLEKLLAYRKWFKKKGAKERYSFEKFRILFLTTESERRKNSILEYIKEHDDVLNSRLFAVGHKNYSIEDPEPILDAIWQCAEDYGEVNQQWHTILD